MAATRNLKKGFDPSTLANRCTATTKATGERCRRSAIAGATVCRAHGGAAKQVRVKAAVRAEVMHWGLGDKTVDPGEILLRLVTQSAARAARYAEELEKAVDQYGFVDAMVDEVHIQTENGSYKAGEYIRALAQLEAQERDRCANFASKAIAAGLNERMVRLAERQGEMLAAIVMTALSEVTLPADKAAALKASIARQVRELA